MDRIDFDGRAVIVTGAGNGLGRAHALDLGRRGACVVVNDFGVAVDGSGGSSDAADEVVAEIEASGGSAVPSYDSVATAEGGRAIVETAMSAFGRLDAVVNNAGILRNNSFGELTHEQLTGVLETHLLGAFYVSQPAFCVMRDAGYGRFVFTSSGSGLFGLTNQANYVAAKAGVAGLSSAVALEGAAHGIRSNVVAPVAVSTRMAMMGGAATSGTETPARLSEAAVAPMVVYLASKECAYSGSIFSAGGGRYARIMAASAPGWTASDGPASPESVRDHLDEITDLRSPLYFDTGDDEMRLILRRP